MIHFIHNWMDQFGYVILLFALMLELLALPLPGEVIMTYAGLLVFQGKLNWTLSVLTAGAGASAGMTISYWIGYKLGTPFFEKYGAKIHLGPEKLQQTSRWFDRYGNKLLIIAFYIPGIRHFTGYFSGTTRMSFRTYMVFAYIGAFIWTGTFISLGKILGPKWEQFHHAITKYLLVAGIVAAVCLLVYYVYRHQRDRIYKSVASGLSNGVRTFHSLGRVKFLVLISSCLFLLLFAFMLGLIQDFLANEFADFDDVAAFIIHAVFDENWDMFMRGFASLASVQALIITTVISAIWVIWRGHDRLLETGFLAVVLVGGELWGEILRRLFHRSGPQELVYSFPSEQTLTTIIFMGFAAYILVRHVNLAWVRTGAAVVVLAISFVVGVSRIYYDIQFPSDVVAGYVFGGVWLSFNIVLLELFRFLRHNRLNYAA